MASIEQKFIQQATERAAADTEFRARLLDNAKAALEETGATVPVSHTVRAIEEGAARPADADTVIVIPAATGTRPELGVEELEEVAGGLTSENGLCGNVNKCSAVGL